MDLETKAIRIARKIWPDHPAKIRVKRTRCGWAYGDGNITIPEWAMRSSQPGCAVYIVAHELAHVKAGTDANHGPKFMEAFKSLCPKSYWKYEKCYKPRHAHAAGIR